MNAYQALSAPIRRYIYERGWHRLRPIQEAAIQMAVSTEDNLVLAAPTASGKTEAAYLPAISLSSFHRPGLRILTLSPLIALINDQFRRVKELCDSLDIPVTAWHGEASPSAKKRLLQNPRGILIITPESLEAMLDTHPERARRLFGQLDWILVDELHSFLGNPRGTQLQSLLYRLKSYLSAPPRYIGMSATLAEGNYQNIKSFFPSERRTSILLDRRQNPLFYDVHLHSLLSEEAGEGGKLSQEERQAGFSALCDGIFEDAKEENMLVFPNSRRRVEEVAAALKHRASLEGFPLRVFAHHSSVEKELRQEAEEFVRQPDSRFVICATSTLELGIDIGSVDAITQLDAPFSASSLSQRLGRSGRGELVDPVSGKLSQEPSRLHLRATTDWDLLQGLAALQMVKEGRLDRVGGIPRPYDVLAHQLLALVLERSGLSIGELYDFSSQAPVWKNIKQEEVYQLVEFLLDKEYLELLEGPAAEVIIGLAAEPLLRRYDFYVMFQSSQDFDVMNGKERIGSLPYSPEMMVGARFLLSARIWQVVAIEEKARKIRVIPAHMGKAPVFGGSSGEVGSELRGEMLAILRQPPAEFLADDRTAQALGRLRESYPSSAPIQPLDTSPHEMALGLFIGSQQERTLFLLLRSVFGAGTSPSIFWSPASGRIYGADLGQGLYRLAACFLQQGKLPKEDLHSFLMEERDLRQRMLADVKYAYLLPDSLQADYIIYNLCDFGLEKPLLSFFKQNGYL